MRRGQSTLEYGYIIGIMAVAVIAMLVYVSRGMQGQVRSAADQVGAGMYSPDNTQTSNSSVKGLASRVVSQSTTQTTYGNGRAQNDAMLANQADQKVLRDQVDAIKADTSLSYEERNDQLEPIIKDLNVLGDAYKVLATAWEARTIYQDVTASQSSNDESGRQTANSHINERLGTLSNDAWK